MADYEDKKDALKPFTLFDNENAISYEIPVIKSTEGPNVIDISSLFKKPGMFTY